jgi:hypothetical protein
VLVLAVDNLKALMIDAGTGIGLGSRVDLQKRGRTPSDIKEILVKRDIIFRVNGNLGTDLYSVLVMPLRLVGFLDRTQSSEDDGVTLVVQVLPLMPSRPFGVAPGSLC